MSEKQEVLCVIIPFTIITYFYFSGWLKHGMRNFMNKGYVKWITFALNVSVIFIVLSCSCKAH